MFSYCLLTLAMTPVNQPSAIRRKGIQKITVADLVNTELCTVKRNEILFIKRFAN